MYKVFLLILLFLSPIYYTSNSENKTIHSVPTTENQAKLLYQEIGLDNVVDYNAFEKAYIGYSQIRNKKKAIITLIDFTQPSTQDRLFVVDLKNKKLLFTSLVAHGKNSGDKFATSFSNKRGSNKSSLGFYLTDETYNGRNGFSLRLNGLEKGINDKARERGIVIHGASYCNPSFLSTGRLGRSQGCPALPENLNTPIINTIKGGSVVYIYAKSNHYFAQSNILPKASKTKKDHI